MKRATLYSRSKPVNPPATERARVLTPLEPGDSTATTSQQPLTSSTKGNAKHWRARLKDPRVVLTIGLLIGLAIGLTQRSAPPAAAGLDRAGVESIVLETLTNQPLPSRAAQIAAGVWPSLVSIRTLDGEPPPPNLISQTGKGTGFVIKEDGTILTNLHVVAGSERIVVTFADGMESPAVVATRQPERDLAVLIPAMIPDDLEPVTLAASGQLMPGDLVVAVGFPFGLGASVSAGVVSGLDREYPLPGREPLKGLIQFDAAVNPGSSGGPLLNDAGEVVGVVTALLNPSPSGTFAGIGFAITMDSAANAVGIPPF
jgi:S1-C subfamily serine protease